MWHNCWIFEHALNRIEVTEKLAERSQIAQTSLNRWRNMSSRITEECWAPLSHWSHPESQKPIIARTIPSHVKVMFTVFLDYSGITQYEFFTQGQTMNKDKSDRNVRIWNEWLIQFTPFLRDWVTNISCTKQIVFQELIKV